MKTNIYYRLGIIAMCVMTIYEIVVSAILMETLDDPEICGDNRWFLLFYPITVLAIASIAGLVLYIRKKVLGWFLCCGYSVFMFVVTVIGYYAFQQIGIYLGESTSDLLAPAIIQGTLYAVAVWLFFYPSDTLLIFRFRARQVVGFNSRSHCGCHRHRHSLLYAYSGEISENSLCGYFFLHNYICPKMGYRSK